METLITPQIEVPEALNMPQKLLPLLTELDTLDDKDNYTYTYFYVDGGRGGGKTQTVARILLYLGDKYKIRIVCGRETQASIEESVYTVIVDIIRKYGLRYRILANEVHNVFTGTTIRFRGFREQGAINIKGLEGVDILWIDEAQAIKKQTLDIIIPTILRNQRARVYFTLNRFIRTDAVFEFCSGRSDCLHLSVNYYDNPFCAESLKKEAQECFIRDEVNFNHIWLGHPLESAEDYFFNLQRLQDAKHINPYGIAEKELKVAAFDLSGGGGDYSVGTLLSQKSPLHWEVDLQYTWNERDTDSSVGRIIALTQKWLPDVTVIDADGLGYPMYVTCSKSIKRCIGFKGAQTENMRNKEAGNWRSDAYLEVKNMIDAGYLILRKANVAVDQLSTIRRNYKSSGQVYLMSKVDMRSKGIKSPDHADSLAMAVWGISRIPTQGYTSRRETIQAPVFDNI